MSTTVAQRPPIPKRRLRTDHNQGRSGAIPGVCRYLVEPVGSVTSTTAAGPRIGVRSGGRVCNELVESEEGLIRAAEKRD